MKIITYSDLHLEFGANIVPAPQDSADLMVLAGDIITFKDFSPLAKFLREWKKPVLYVAGNHEYYTLSPMRDNAAAFKSWLAEEQPHVHFLQDEAITIDGVQFFGGTMWTEFSGGNMKAMIAAKQTMNDFRYIFVDGSQFLHPADTVRLHEAFVEKLVAWLETGLNGPRVVISHHAPVINPNTQHLNSPLAPAFNSLDMVDIIKKYQPKFWIYGHTHECDNQVIGKTCIISNQSGYPNRDGSVECKDFDRAGLMIDC
ncbi:MAG: metallophosphoesterase [Rickettsiales bacterium]|nr:metallophosphoesterase [Rickettsiales bacterium]